MSQRVAAANLRPRPQHALSTQRPRQFIAPPDCRGDLPPQRQPDPHKWQGPTGPGLAEMSRMVAASDTAPGRNRGCPIPAIVRY
jgi:hypothetical protein